MALVLADRVRDTTTTASTGTITLSGTAPTGYQNFSVIGDGNTTYYTIAGQGTSEWEVGIGTYTSSGTTLARTTVLASSNGGSLVNFSAGTKDVFVTYPAERSVNLSSTALTSGRVPYATTDGLLTNSTNLTFDGTKLTVGGLLDSALTSGRVPYATTSGELTDSANLTFNGTTLTANTIGAFTLSGTVAGGGNQINNVVIGTSTPLAGSFTTVSASTSVTTPSVTNAGTLALSATGANIVTASTNGSERMRIDSSGNVGIGTASPGSALDVKGTLRLSGSTSGYVGLAPAAAAGSTTYTLPSADGTNGQALTTDGSGVLSWASAGGGFASGTLMLFQQTAAPTGWTKQTTHNDKALRVVSGSASSGGTTAFSTVFTNQTPTITTSGLSAAATTLTTTQIPSHTHSGRTSTSSAGAAASFDINVVPDSSNIGNTGGGGSHTHSLTGSATSSAITLNVQYVDLIIASKD